MLLANIKSRFTLKVDKFGLYLINNNIDYVFAYLKFCCFDKTFESQSRFCLVKLKHREKTLKVLNGFLKIRTVVQNK